MRSDERAIGAVHIIGVPVGGSMKDAHGTSRLRPSSERAPEGDRGKKMDARRQPPKSPAHLPLNLSWWKICGFENFLGGFR